jgi:hypothetical protein
MVSRFSSVTIHTEAGQVVVRLQDDLWIESINRVVDSDHEVDAEAEYLNSPILYATGGSFFSRDVVQYQTLRDFPNRVTLYYEHETGERYFRDKFGEWYFPYGDHTEAPLYDLELVYVPVQNDRSWNLLIFSDEVSLISFDQWGTILSSPLDDGVIQDVQKIEIPISMTPSDEDGLDMKESFRSVGDDLMYEYGIGTNLTGYRQLLHRILYIEPLAGESKSRSYYRRENFVSATDQQLIIPHRHHPDWVLVPETNIRPILQVKNREIVLEGVDLSGNVYVIGSSRARNDVTQLERILPPNFLQEIREVPALNDRFDYLSNWRFVPEITPSRAPGGFIKLFISGREPFYFVNNKYISAIRKEPMIPTGPISVVEYPKRFGDLRVEFNDPEGSSVGSLWNVTKRQTGSGEDCSYLIDKFPIVPGPILYAPIFHLDLLGPIVYDRISLEEASHLETVREDLLPEGTVITTIDGRVYFLPL